MSKEIIYRCDRCGKTITDKLFGVYIEELDRNNKELMENGFPYPEDMDLDFCEDCAKAIHEHLRKPPKATLPAPAVVMEIPEVVEELPYDGCQELAEYAELTGEQSAKTAQSRKKLDYGKIDALKNAGWKAKDIADELGTTTATIYDAVRRMKGKEKKEP